jgi:sulfur-carrier protein
MIRVCLYTITEFKEIIGQSRTELSLPDGSRLQDFLNKILQVFGSKLSTKLVDAGTGEVFPYIRIAVNGQDIAFLKGTETELKEGDEVLIIPPVAGG